MYSIAANMQAMASDDDDYSSISSTSSSDDDAFKINYISHTSLTPKQQNRSWSSKTTQTRLNNTTKSRLTDAEKHKALTALSMAGFTINRLARQHTKALLWAASVGSTYAVTYLLDHYEQNAAPSRRFNLSIPKPRSSATATTTTPLHLAAVNGHDSIIRLLLSSPSHASSINAPTPTTHQTPLQLAASSNHDSTLRLLLSHGADPNLNSSSSTPALHHAVSHSNFIAVNLLLEAGADINARDRKTGQTALHVVAATGCDEVAFMLVVRGARVDVVDIQGVRPVDVAKREGCESMRRLFESIETDENVERGRSIRRGRGGSAVGVVMTGGVQVACH